MNADFFSISDCIECMACSDNVVRAGLTPKFIDASTLCEMLLYEPGTTADNMFPAQPDATDPCVMVYNPPIPDFTVAQIKVCSSLFSQIWAWFEYVSEIIQTMFACVWM